jgi:DNA-binding transcriptional LysR family regulator
VRVRGSIYSNFGEALKHAALLGHGISIHPYYMVSDDLAAGRLREVLPGYESPELDIYVIFSSRQNVPVRLRRFLEFLKDWANTPPDWSRSARYEVDDETTRRNGRRKPDRAKGALKVPG